MTSTDPPAPIQAYYKLSFPNFEYYLQTLSVSIGRRPQSPPPPHVEDSAETQDATAVVEHVAPQDPPIIKQEDADALLKLAELAAAGPEAARAVFTEVPVVDPQPPQSPHPSTSSARRSRRSQSHSSAAFPHVDVDLGPLKSVSRLHARIDYDDSIDKFVLYVNGRNGAWVDGEWVGCGGRVALGARTKIQIATRTFYFILPPPSDPQPPLTPEATPDADVEPTSADDPVQPLSPAQPSCPRSPSPRPAKRRRRNMYPRAARPVSSVPAEAPLPPVPLPDAAEPSGSSSSSTQSSKTQAAVENDHENDGSESENDQLVSINDLEQDDLDELQAMDPQTEDDEDEDRADVKGKGKAPARKGNKSTTSRKAPKSRHAQKAPKLLEGPPSSQQRLQMIARPLPAKVAKNLLKPPPDPNQPRQPKKYMTQRLIAKSQLMQIPRPPPDQMPPKPPFTYAILCYRAIQELGGKASLSEIVNWIRDKHEWYRWNDECGWESSVRHNLSSNPGFVKSRRDAEVERIVSTTGQQKKVKGFFWSIDPKTEESFREKEREIVEAGSRAKAQQKAKMKEGSAADGMVMTAGPGGVGGIKGAGQAPSSAKPALPVPMMAPRGMPSQSNLSMPPPVGMTMTPGMHPGPPHMIPPMMIPPHHAHIPTPTLRAPPPPPPPVQFTPASHPPPIPSPAFPQTLPDVCLSITVGPPPPGANIDAFSSPHVDGPPITLHNGALFLNPTIFSGLNQAQLDELQKLKAQKALEILTGYTKNYVKEQIVKKGKAKAKAKARKSGADSAVDAPVTSTPTPPLSGSTQPAEAPQYDTASILAVANLAAASAPLPSTSPLSLSPPAPPSLPQPVPPQPGQEPYAYYPFPYQGGGGGGGGAWTYPSHPQPQSHHPNPSAPQFPPPMMQHMHYAQPYPPPYPQHQFHPMPMMQQPGQKTGLAHALEETDDADGGPATKKAKIEPPAATHGSKVGA